ncbi:MAG TPA: glyoxalase [Blastocatellia bacterium]|nr:glyoxalase [Blastocatellia bacterium]
MSLTIKELVTYVPSEDFGVSQRFYRGLGFELTEGWGGTMDCRLGNAVFRLQNYHNKDWAENFMMKFDVDDIEGWHANAKGVIDNGDFGHARYDNEIELVGGDTKIFHVWDPCGVLLIFIG